MIPKVIHYCWFGGTPLPKSALKCIESWKRFLPDYEIKEWNEDNFDVDVIPYTKEAYEAKKFAFVSDYARFWILYHFGGIYFDTDVEVIRPIDDIIERGPFMGREAGAWMKAYGYPNGLAVNPGLAIGAEANNSLYKGFLYVYQSLSFCLPDGKLNTKTICWYVTEMLLKHGLTDNIFCIEQVGGIWIYPAEYFCPMDHTKGCYVKITERTRTIHHYDASWNNHTIFQSMLARIKKWIVRFYYTIKDGFR